MCLDEMKCNSPEVMKESNTVSRESVNGIRETLSMAMNVRDHIEQ